MYKGVDDQGPYYEVRYLFDHWADSDAVVNLLLGLASRSGGTTTRTGPHQHPLSPNLYCRSARVEGVGGPLLNANGFPSYDSGFFVRATYRAWIPEGLIDPAMDPFGFQQIDPTTPLLWCTQELDWDTDWVSVPNHAYKWISDASPAPIPVKVPSGITTMRITFHRFPFLPMGPMRTYRNKVNTTTFLGAAPKTVLCKGANVRREYLADGTVAQTVGLIFLERDQKWVNYFRPDTMKWDTVYFPAPGGSVFLYQDTDLNPLLQAFF